MAADFPRTRAAIDQGIAEHLHLGAQLYISQHGRTLIDRAFGASRPDVAMTPDTLNIWMSSGKPVTAVAIAQLWEHKRLKLDDRVVRYIPEFGQRGKEAITIRHILTHTCGFRAVIGLRWTDPFDVAIEKICRAALEPRWIIGKTAGYHASSSWYVLAEIVRRIDGRAFERYVREEIFLPAGMSDCWVGMPVQQFHEYGSRIGFLYDTSQGADPLTDSENANSEADATAVRPSANARGPIRQLGRFYETLIGVAAGNPPSLVSPQALEAMTARQRAGLYDRTFRHVVDMGLGFIINSSQYGDRTVPYGYGPFASLRTFGHSGHESSCAFCDPEIGLVAAWFCNGQPGDERHEQRQQQINLAIYQDLGLDPAAAAATSIF